MRVRQFKIIVHTPTRLILEEHPLRISIVASSPLILLLVPLVDGLGLIKMSLAIATYTH